MARTYQYRHLIHVTGQNVAHLTSGGPVDTFGHWYTDCGRVVPGVAADNLRETDAAKVCAQCHYRATKLERHAAARAARKARKVASR